MINAKLTESFLANIAGWEAMKSARALVAAGRVSQAEWNPPLLKGCVREGETTFRAGLRIADTINVENLCTCRTSRRWGTICAHSVAVGLYQLNPPAMTPATSTETNRQQASPVEAKVPRFGFSDQEGVPAELAIILPPNLQEAALHNKIMVALEVKSGGKSIPAGALPHGQSYRFSSLEVSILRQIEQLAGEIPSMTLFNCAQFSSLLNLLRGHHGTTLGRKQPLEIVETPFVAVKAELLSNGEIRLHLGTTAAIAVCGDWVLRDHRFYFCPWLSRHPALPGRPEMIPRRSVPEFLNRDWPEMQASGALEANFTLDQFQVRTVVPVFRLHLAGGLSQLNANLECVYEGQILSNTSPESLWIPGAASVTEYWLRDPDVERQAVARLLAAGFSGPSASGDYELRNENAVLNFFARDYPRLRKDWEITLEERLERSTQKNVEWITPRVEIKSSGIDWFELNLSFSTAGGEAFSPADIQRLLRSSQSHTKLKNGKIALFDTAALDEFQEVLRDCNPQQGAGAYRLAGTQAAFVSATLAETPGWRVQAPALWKEEAARVSGRATMEPPALTGLDHILRPYQKQGVGWLKFLREHRFGGILADEMGLGKTLQILAFVSWVRSQHHQLSPGLVVCPSSLVFNWLDEARKFVPHLRLLDLSGPDRIDRWEALGDCDLAVTSYALLRRDAELYRTVEFDTVILDEAQHIKNRQTQNAQTVKSVRSHYRLVLTGTPMENSVSDLWSIFDFLMPGYLGGAEEFRERYELPMSRERDAATTRRLARRLRPFILRRRKQEVAPELPARIEQVSFCELSQPQKAVYEQIMALTRKEVSEAVGAQGLAKSRMLVLTALLRLRQVCCDLRLLKLDQSIAAPAVSGKMELFDELIEEVIDGGHRVLVFSQFVSLLQLLRERLQADGVRFCYLDGSTVDRGSIIHSFQNDAGIPVFLISLKAGGVGLNLTGADTVIHFDPWWNPAVEDQATDRAHRIGQIRTVTSYKLIARGTIEEKILHLQEKKRQLIHATLSGEEQLTETLTWEEIQELLA